MSAVRIIGTCPSFRNDSTAEQFVRDISKTCEIAERYNWSSLLVYTDNAEINPWQAADLVMRHSVRVSPLVAVQPIYMHPFAVAQAMASLSVMHGRPVNINLVSGGFPRDLDALGDSLNHDERYERVVEYGILVRHLLTERKPITYDGIHYNVKGLKLPNYFVGACFPPLITVAGSSPAGRNAARQLGAHAIQYLQPYAQLKSEMFERDLTHGTRVGVIARSSNAEAWRAAEARFPPDAFGEEARTYFTQISDSAWVKNLSQMPEPPQRSVYWLGPYKTNRAACPYLVGDVDSVAAELAGYMTLGLRTFLVELPADDDDAEYLTTAFRLAAAASGATFETM